MSKNGILNGAGWRLQAATGQPVQRTQKRR